MREIRGDAKNIRAMLKDAVLKAAEAAGDKAGLVGYLTTQAKQNPTAFMSLLGRVLPIQNAVNDDGRKAVTDRPTACNQLNDAALTLFWSSRMWRIH